MHYYDEAEAAPFRGFFAGLSHAAQELAQVQPYAHAYNARDEHCVALQVVDPQAPREVTRGHFYRIADRSTSVEDSVE